MASATLDPAAATPIAAPIPIPQPADTAPRAGAIHGTLLSPDGEPVNPAHLTLTPASGPALHVEAEPDGSFLFTGVPPGRFTLAVAAQGFEASSTTGSLASADSVDLASLTLRVATLVTSVSAITPEQAAEIEVTQEEHQRIVGAIPNFFVSYDAEPVSLTSRQKLRLSLRTAIDPATIAVSALIAGGETAANSYPGFGTGAAGYGKRFGASLADGTTGVLLTGYAFPSLFHQDPRYFYKGTGGFPSRLGYVIKQAVEQKGDNGHWQFAWSNTFGSISSSLISNTYYPAQHDKWATLTAENYALGIASQGIANFLQEFVFSRVTTRHGQ